MNREPDLFEWAKRRPTGQVINIVPKLLMRIWRERGRDLPIWQGDVVPMPKRPESQRPKRRIA